MECSVHWKISSLSSRSSVCEVSIFGGEKLSSPLSLAVLSVSFRSISGCCFLELLGHCTCVLLVWYPGAIPYRIRIREVRFPLLATFVILHHFCVEY